MSHTAHQDEYYMTEHFDCEDVFNDHVDKLVNMIQKSKHFIVFTGAGVSTSAGIPDFRGPNGTWTLKAQNKVRTTPTTSTIKAFPTRSHMALVELQNRGILKYLISQNCDGLHRRSGIHPDNISELHGNSTIEYCEDCLRQYPRDFHCTRLKKGRDHYTGRHCVVPGCNGRLLNSTIDFGQDLPKEPLKLAQQHAKKADLCLVLGSSLTVTPACEIPEKVAKMRQKLVICNLQKTPVEDLATLNIHAKCDDLMQAVMNKLGIEIPKWKLVRKVVLKHEINHNQLSLLVQGVDRDDANLPSSIFKKVALSVDDEETFIGEEEPFIFKDISLMGVADDRTGHITANIKFHFRCHYQEPALKMECQIPLSQKKGSSFFELMYHPGGEWFISQVLK
jgi:NAD-dependent SIR2 family protein deacetylase